eukprot:556878-Rhodomonas_salina.2
MDMRKISCATSSMGNSGCYPGTARKKIGSEPCVVMGTGKTIWTGFSLCEKGSAGTRHRYPEVSTGTRAVQNTFRVWNTFHVGSEPGNTNTYEVDEAGIPTSGRDSYVYPGIHQDFIRFPAWHQQSEKPKKCALCLEDVATTLNVAFCEAACLRHVVDACKAGNMPDLGSWNSETC